MEDITERFGDAEEGIDGFAKLSHNASFLKDVLVAPISSLWSGNGTQSLDKWA